MAKQKRAKQQWVKVMSRFADRDVRSKNAVAMEKQIGRPLSDHHAFNMNVAFAVDQYGFIGAFEAAKAFIESDQGKYGDTFEYQLDGGEW